MKSLLAPDETDLSSLEGQEMGLHEQLLDPLSLSVNHFSCADFSLLEWCRVSPKINSEEVMLTQGTV